MILRRSHTASRVAVGAASVLAGLASLAPIPGAAEAPVALAVPTPVVTPSPTPVPVLPLRPVRIELPTLRVIAPIVAVGLDPTGAMETPTTAKDVAWWDGIHAGAGNALFAGHRDWKKVPGSFYRLQDLKPGDPVVVHGESGRLDFRVEWTRQVPGDAEPTGLLTDEGRPVITLITCGGVFDRRTRHYQDRVVVRAGLVT